MKKAELTVSRAIPATASEVFDVWLDPKSPGSPWFGPQRVILNAIVDGLFFHEVEHEGRTWAHYGRFVEIDRPRRIQHTWMSEATQGVETIVTLTFEPSGDETQLTLHHADVPDDEMGRRHEEGWKYILGSIADRFSRPKS